ncbi:MAG: ComEC/Rec2 family competence protein [Campylobacterales bacterium]|nr:ComEC/Rec2 family competence protein [Campylobacterales bacterium]
MQLERVALFDRRSLLIASAFLLALFALSLLNEYSNYKQLTRFDSAELEALVQNHYIKTKENKTYSVLKLRFGDKSFYTTGSKHWRDLVGRTLHVRIWTQNIGFVDYLCGFYAHSVVLHVKPDLAANVALSKRIAAQHEDAMMGELYGALFAATPMSPPLRDKLAASGTSHLLAISGFHLGVIAALIYALLTSPYRYVQARYFPYRHRRRDLFMIAATLCLGYLLFLGWVPSMLRAVGMMLIAFWLYDRGVKVVSMQNLALTVALLLCLWPSLIFSVGFWLSVMGVYYIFLYLRYFGERPLWQSYILLGVWVYVMMVPVSLWLFGTFSLYHPLSIVWSLVFTLFYPLVLLLHVSGYGGLFDGSLLWAMGHLEVSEVTLSSPMFGLQVTLSLLALWRRRFAWGALGLGFGLTCSALYEVA